MCIALWGTLLAIVHLGAARPARRPQPRARTPLVYLAARRVMDVLRAVNEFVFALMFVTAVGLGPFAGMLALGLHTGGVLGKLLSETIEAIDPGQMEGVAAVGAGRLHVIAFGVVPQVMPNFLSYILLRFESDIRSASVIGMVGRRRHRLLPVGHHPGLQRPGGGHGDPAHRRHGDVRRRGVVPDPAGGDLTTPAARRIHAHRMPSAGGAPCRPSPWSASRDRGQDAAWPKEITFALLSTENAAEITRRWGPIIGPAREGPGRQGQAGDRHRLPGHASRR